MSRGFSMADSPSYRTGRLLIVVLLLMGPALITAPAAGLLNPASVYCSALGYRPETDHTLKGDYVYCRISETVRLDAWKFLLGQAGEEYSYCRRMGFDQVILTGRDQCFAYRADFCAACVFPNGTTTEVGQAMQLSFLEGRCGDGRCSDPEDALTCPQDCPSGVQDFTCDGKSDGMCDPDCAGGTGDPDCGGGSGGGTAGGLNPLIIVGIGILIVVMIAIAIIRMRRTQGQG
jgi:putative hemolysin